MGRWTLGVGPCPSGCSAAGCRGAGTGPALAVHSMWKAPECEAVRHTCTHTHTHTCTRTHTRMHTQHTHRHLVHSVGAFPSPRARAPAPASVLVLPTGTQGCAHPQPRSGGQCVRGCLQASGRPSLRPLPTYLQSWTVTPRLGSVGGAQGHARRRGCADSPGEVSCGSHTGMCSGHRYHTQSWSWRGCSCGFYGQPGRPGGQRGFAAGSGRQGQTLVGDDTPGGSAQ